jgi:segregation and condensation protein A
MDDAGYSIETPHFSGPLELLLNLIEARKLHINDISLAQVTDDYLGYVGKLEQFPTHETAQFIVIAATLLLIKSRSLLPNFAVTQEEEEEIEDLERRLALYKVIRDGSRILRKQWGIARMWEPQRVRTPDPVFAPGELSTALIHAALKNMVTALPASVFRPETKVAKKITLEEVMDGLVQRLQNRVGRFSDIVKSGAEREVVVLHFLAILELVRRQMITVEQKNRFDDIFISHDAIHTPRFG